MDFASLARSAEDGARWKGIAAKLFVVSQRPGKAMG